MPPRSGILTSGAAVELVVADQDGVETVHLLGPDVRGNQRPQVIVPLGAWQRARTVGEYSLVGLHGVACLRVVPLRVGMIFGYHMDLPPGNDTRPAMVGRACGSLMVPLPTRVGDSQGAVRRPRPWSYMAADRSACPEDDPSARHAEPGVEDTGMHSGSPMHQAIGDTQSVAVDPRCDVGDDVWVDVLRLLIIGWRRWADSPG